MYSYDQQEPNNKTTNATRTTDTSSSTSRNNNSGHDDDHQDDDHDNVVAAATIRWDFQPLHIFPLYEADLETAIDTALHKAQPYRYSAVIFALGTWYNWDWSEEHVERLDYQQQQQHQLQQQQKQYPEDTNNRLVQILHDQCPAQRAQEYFRTHPFRTDHVYAYAQQTRLLCPPLLQYDAYIAGLTMLRNVYRKRQRRKRRQEKENNNDDDDAWPAVVLWKQVSVQHFDTASGNYDIIAEPPGGGSSGGTNDQKRSSTCVPLRNTTLNYERNRVAEAVLLANDDNDDGNDDHDADADTDAAATGTTAAPMTMFQIIPTFAAEMDAFDQHISGQDCTHYCNPSPIMLGWVEAAITNLVQSVRSP
jgi:hypothetical protein